VEEDADILITASPARKNPYFNMVEISNGSVDVVKHSGLSKILIGAKASIRKALSALSKSGEKCLIVVGPSRKLIGTLSDGDLRKAILKGAGTDQPITQIYNTNPVRLIKETYEADHVRKIFLENKFDLIPIVDEVETVVDFVVWEEFFTDGETISNSFRNINLAIPASRQNVPEVYDMNASIYIWKRQALVENDTLFTDKTSLFIMPEERSVDIDTSLDWAFVEFMIGKKVDSDG
jgi:CBS domain-containing protein